MVNRVEKFLARLTKRELVSVQALILDITNGETKHLDVKSLKGSKYTYRVRKGRLRVIFERRGTDIRIVWIGNRDDQTYRDF